MDAQARKVGTQTKVMQILLWHVLHGPPKGMESTLSAGGTDEQPSVRIPRLVPLVHGWPLHMLYGARDARKKASHGMKPLG